ncbi:PatA/PatG family cyanobactin maturation protease [Calothrix sp. PCC 6303]|uniref:PatA/PatG family cyanobactin maturation protease n=1 Tax=Calothrix sp. PCC 6303 TaxID=1170562 RepID=UPI0002A014FB|nr:PatA/PatG family cyanobactin maturation protease [Calothrix sp. PCC 6303]AFZ01069.1 peptidase S8 and S53 subtilisin kexin sedolisin [Calothrix sp. PCC 6303]
MMSEIDISNFAYEKFGGDSKICVAVLDGPVDQSHPCFDGANLTQLPTLVSSVADRGSASQHGTHVASVIFGQHDSPVRGIAPNCRGLIVPVFSDGRDGLAPCSQIDLARAITQAVEQGANVINISGGQLAASAESDRLLANAVRLCRENNVLIVAAAGNDGCDCLHLPAALESVLAVGAMDAQGNPIGFSNWGEAYQNQGILALGENILGAIPGAKTATKTGTSFATPIVSGIVALLLSIQLQREEKPDPHAIRDAILQSALSCNQLKGLDSRRCLVGTLNISGAYTLITKGEIKQMTNEKSGGVMIQSSEADNAIAQLQPSEVIEFDLKQEISQSSPIGVQAAEINQLTTMLMKETPMMITASNQANSSVAPSECASCSGSKQIQLVYALGELGYDFGTQARQDSFTQAIPAGINLLDYLEQNPWEAQSLIWTLNLDATPIYAIVPSGPYANVTYERLRSFLGDENIERVSIPGYIAGSVKLLSGQTVPAIIPEVRGMYGWSVAALIENLTQAYPAGPSEEDYSNKIREYLERIYYEFRNLGVTPQERALNFSATNAFQIADVMSTGTAADIGLDTITVEKSPICRPDSNCYDVKLQFFNLEDSRRAGKVYRFTVDVSDAIPVSIGRVRSWSVAS